MKKMKKSKSSWSALIYMFIILILFLMVIQGIIISFEGMAITGSALDEEASIGFVLLIIYIFYVLLNYLINIYVKNKIIRNISTIILLIIAIVFVYFGGSYFLNNPFIINMKVYWGILIFLILNFGVISYLFKLPRILKKYI